MEKLLAQNGYVLDEKNSIWHKPSYEGIEYNDGDEIEERIAKIINQAEDISVLSTELKSHITDWPSLYHLSSTRGNILRPFSEKLVDADVLEVGAGCGAITRFLGESDAHVVAIEGSPRRARIARSRTRDLQNVAVVADNFDNFSCDLKFDVITLIGVLEYANLFVSAETPAEAMLERVRSLLKPGGLLIIAIENQLGLKYFAGAPEDHIGVPMYGIENRYESGQPITFGHQALRKLIKNCGFGNTRFYAPFPDYKLPASIISESGFSDEEFDASALAWQSVKRDPQLPEHVNFSMELAWSSIFENGIGLDLANSFLIAASPHECQSDDEETLAYHYSTERIPAYCKETRFVKSQGSINVMVSLLGNPLPEDTESLIRFRPESVTDYTRGRPLSWQFIQLVTGDGWSIDEVADFFIRYFRILENLQDGKYSIFSKDGKLQDVSLPGKYFDYIPQNIVIKEDGTARVIDTEWTSVKPISVSQLVFRSLLCMVGMVTRFGHPVGGELTKGELVRRTLHALELNVDVQKYESYFHEETRIQYDVTRQSNDDFMSLWREASLPTESFATALAYRQNKLLVTEQLLAKKEAEYDAIINSTSWRITQPLRQIRPILSKIKRLSSVITHAPKIGGGYKATLRKAINLYRQEGVAGIKRGIQFVSARSDNRYIDRNNYAEWIDLYDTLNDEERKIISERIDALTLKPLISVIMPVYNANTIWLAEAIESVQNQLYPNWELCIADDKSTEPDVRALLEKYAQQDSRIKLIFREENGHISAASNSALTLAAGEWIALMDQDDLLPEHALFWVADALQNNPDAKLIYSDEDMVDESGKRHNPYFKCDWNRDLFYSQNMISHLGVYHHEIIKNIGGFRVGFEGSQDYDLALRFIEQISEHQICHIPRVLYHWRMHAESTSGGADAKPYAVIAGEKALSEHFARTGIAAKVTSTNAGYRVSYQLPSPPPLVSLIIPTRNGLELIRNCVESILSKTRYDNYEILIVDNGSDAPDILKYFRRLEAAHSQVKVIRDERPFNYSALNNNALHHAAGEVIGLINNDIEVIEPDWLTEMVSLAIQPSIGAVGAKLLYPDNQVQHAGVVMGLHTLADHIYKGFDRNDSGYFSRANSINGYSAVTAACLVVTRHNFEFVNGLNEKDLVVAFNDVDFCLKLKEQGLRNVYTPYALLYHHESATRGLEDTPEKMARFKKEIAYMHECWTDYIEHDPCYSPNLSLEHEDCSFAWPPRIESLERQSVKYQETNLGIEKSNERNF